MKAAALLAEAIIASAVIAEENFMFINLNVKRLQAMDYVVLRKQQLKRSYLFCLKKHVRAFTTYVCRPRFNIQQVWVLTFYASVFRYCSAANKTFLSCARTGSVVLP